MAYLWRISKWRDESNKLARHITAYLWCISKWRDESNKLARHITAYYFGINFNTLIDGNILEKHDYILPWNVYLDTRLLYR